ncbi:MAG: GNAT family N-acetyltransferase [Candidatus Heimdallarchaeota archaeon]|nr:GNAT family N-acetyltransferase [Candidatus Heimdallarchaeota archaeon]
MHELQIRSYTDEDHDPVREIIVNAKHFGPSYLETEEKLMRYFSIFSDIGRILVAVLNGEIVAYAAVEFRRKSLFVTSFMTHHQYLRRGIGKKMIEHISKIGTDMNEIEVIRVDTSDDMKDAQKFYLSNGFQICGYVSHDLAWNSHQVHLVKQICRS